MVLFARRPPKVKFSKLYISSNPTNQRCLIYCQGRRLLIIATSSVRPVLTDLGLSESFDSELRVPPISNLRGIERVLEAVELFSTVQERHAAIRMLEQAGFGNTEAEDEDSSRLNIGIKKFLSVVEMARQEPEAVAERLTGALMGLGM